MKIPLRTVLVLGLATCGSLAACGSTDEDSAQAALDAAVDSAPPPDTGADASDAAPTDAGPDVDCSRIGCGPPPICGEACTGPCGCCFCGVGSEMTVDGVTYTCTGPCWAPVADAGLD